MATKFIRQVFVYVGTAAFIAIIFTLLDAFTATVWPGINRSSYLPFGDYLSHAVFPYFVFVFVSGLPGFVLYPIIKRLPGIRGKGLTPGEVAAGFMLLSFMPLVLLMIYDNTLFPFVVPHFLIVLFVVLPIYFIVSSTVFPAFIKVMSARLNRLPRKTSLVTSAIALTLVLGSLIAVHSRFLFRPPYEENAPNLLVISIDTLRKDHVSFYGYDGIKTPNIDRFLGESTRFDNAYCSSPWTFPSFSSFLTGYQPGVCGVDHYHSMSPEMTTLTEILHDKGYRTECYNGNWSMYPEYGFGRGFDIYVDPTDSPLLYPFSGTRIYRSFNGLYRKLGKDLGLTWENEAAFNADMTIKSIKRGGDRPFFIWCQFFDPHTPYDPPIGYLNVPPEDRREIRKRSLKSQELPIDDPALDIEAMMITYDGEIAYVDENIGRILDYLDESVYSENTVVVLFNDHGEAFMERGRWGHGFSVYPAIIDMVLAIRDPFAADAVSVSEKYVSHIDIMPTILDILGIEIPSGLQGETLLTELTDPTHEENAKLSEYSMEMFEEMRGVRRGGYLYVKDYGTGATGLFNITEDPGALNDVSAKHPDIVKELGDELTVMERQNKEIKNDIADGSGIEIREEDKNRLRDIGYLDN